MKRGADGDDRRQIEIDARWDRASYAAGDDRPALLELGVTARRAKGEAAAKVPAEVVLVLDVSASMNEPGCYPLVAQAVERFLSSLDTADRAAIAVFSHAGGLVSGLEEGAALAGRWPDIEAGLRASEVFYGHRTNLYAGLLPAVAELRMNSRPEAARRIYVLTDGCLHDHDACEILAAELARDRIELQIHGFGLLFDPEQLSRLVRRVPGGLVKPLVDTRRVLDVFRHLADTSGRIALCNVRVDVRFAPGVIAGDAFSLAPSRRWLGAVEGGVFTDELFSLEYGRRYTWLFELRLPEGAVGTATAGMASVLGEQGGAARHGSTMLEVERTDEDGAVDPAVSRGHALVAAERDDDPETRIGALEARLSLCRDEGRDPALIAALERRLAALTGFGGERAGGEDGDEDEDEDEDGSDRGLLPLPEDDDLYIGCAECSVQVIFTEDWQHSPDRDARPREAPAADTREVRVLIAATDDGFRRIIETEARAAIEPEAQARFEFVAGTDEMVAAIGNGPWDLLVVLLGDVRTSLFHGRDKRVARALELAGAFGDATGAAVIGLAERCAEAGDLDRLAAEAGFAAFAFLPWEGEWLRDAIRAAPGDG